jgi:hypothetical protein
MRHPAIIAERIKQVIPQDQLKAIQYCDWMINDFSYKAPEQFNECWTILSKWVSNYIESATSSPNNKNPVADWIVDMGSILCDCDKYTMRRQIEHDIESIQEDSKY